MYVVAYEMLAVEADKFPDPQLLYLKSETRFAFLTSSMEKMV
jgi:hypothetical protein